MKIIFSDPRFRRRALFVLVNLVLCVFAIGVVVMPTYTFLADRADRIEGQRVVLARLSAIAAQAETVQSIVSDTKAQMESGEFLSGPNDNVINADLQTKLKALTESTGARSRTVQTLPVRVSDQIRYSGSRIEIAGSLQSVLRAVHTIESAKPYLFITGASLRMLPGSGQGVAQEPVVQAQLEVFGAMRAGSSP